MSAENLPYKFSEENAREIRKLTTPELLCKETLPNDTKNIDCVVSKYEGIFTNCITYNFHPDPVCLDSTNIVIITYAISYTSD